MRRVPVSVARSALIPVALCVLAVTLVDAHPTAAPAHVLALTTVQGMGRVAPRPTPTPARRAGARRVTRGPAPTVPYASSDRATLVYGTTAEPDSLNPQIMATPGAFDLAAAIFDTLLLPDAHGLPTPALATRYTVSRDGLTYTFYLRHGVRWADGQPFTAADVLFTYRQAIEPRNHVFSRRGWDHVARVATPTPYTVVVSTRTVYAPFLAAVGEGGYLLPAHYFTHARAFRSGSYNDDPFNRQPFGTGPYRVTDWVAADHLTLTANPYYWGPRPALRRIVCRFLPNANTLLDGLRTHTIDLGAVSVEQSEAARLVSGKTLLSRPGGAWYHLDLKQWGVLRDRVVRAALAAALPLPTLLRQVWHGLAQPARGDLPPASWAYTPPTATVALSPTAAALLATDGFRKGRDGLLRKGGQVLSLALWAQSNDATAAAIDGALQVAWRRLGIAVTLHTAETATLFGPHGPQFSRAATAITYAWVAGLDPDDSAYWSSTAIPACPTCAGTNALGYFYRFSDQRPLDTLLVAGTATLDRGARRRLYAEVERRLNAQVPVLFLAWQPSLYLQPRGFSGLAPTPFAPLFWNVARWHR